MPTFVPVSSSTIDTYVSIPPSATSILGSVSILDLVRTPLRISLISPIPFFTNSPSISKIVSIPKIKLVIPELEHKKPLKLLTSGKEIEEDIDLDIGIEIPKIDYDTAIVDEMRLTSHLLEKKARQKQLRSERDKE